MMLRILVYICLVISGLSSFSLSAADKGPLNNDTFDFSAFHNKTQESEPLKVTLLSEKKGIQAGQPFWVALKVDVAAGWHTYWKNPGDSGIACSVEWTLPEGFSADACQWPVPHRYKEGSLTYFGYQDEFVLLSQLIAPADLAPGKSVDIGATLRWVACNADTCLPGDSNPSLALPITTAEPSVDTDTQALFTAAREHLPKNDWGVTARRTQEGMIELTLVPPASATNSAIVSADFFPEHTDQINYHHLPILSSENGIYNVLLKGASGLGSKAGALRGVLLLEHGQGENKATDAVTVDVPVADSAATIAPLESSFGLALLLAFIGGAILNLMPCVLPVISVKVLSLVKMAGQSRAAIFRHGLAFCAGVLASFWVLAGALLGLQAYGESVGWGFQLQEPLFVALLAAVLFVFGLSLFGLFEFGLIFSAWAGQRESHIHTQARHGLMASFFGGVLATAVATPCTGPFLGSAVGLAVVLPPVQALAIFTSIGLGMSAPYLLLTAFPPLMRWLPKPGNWMIRFKQLMGFLMIGTVLWLVWIFGAQTSTLGVSALLTGLFILAVACWIYGSWGTPVQRPKTRLISSFFAILLLILGGYLVVASSQTVYSAHISHSEEDGWVPYSREVFEKASAEGKPIFVDFTAKWCLICQANRYVLDVDQVQTQFDKKGVVKMMADWTRPDPFITAELRKHGRSGVPLYLLYAPHAESPVVLPQVLTPEVVLQYLSEMQ